MTDVAMDFVALLSTKLKFLTFSDQQQAYIMSINKYKFVYHTYVAHSTVF